MSPESRRVGCCSASTSAAPDRLLTIRQAAALTSMSTRWIGRRLADGRLPRIKLGRSTRIRLSDIDRIVKEGMA